MLSSSRISFNFLVLISTLVLLYTGISFLSPENQSVFLRENGVVETITLFAYAYCVILIARFGGSDWIKSRWYLVAIIYLLLLRETDMHSKLTGHSIFGTRLYFHPDTSTFTSIMALSVVVFVLWVLYYSLKSHLRPLLNDISHGAAHAMFILAALILAIFSKLIDGATRTFGKVGITVDAAAEHKFMQIEEIAELGIPLALCFAITKYFSNQVQGE
ncbi:MAG: hypothetical protein ACR2QW_08770 [bacterium]